MEFINNKTIKISRELNGLDQFALDFLKILEKHTDYVVVSGYVSILLGRTRSTDDIDIFIKPLIKQQFIELYHDLKNKGFWCLNAESNDEIYSYLSDKISIRFARLNTAVPNFEVRFPKDELDEEVFTQFLTVIIDQGKIKISPPERQIAFKRYYLGTPKDLEDASHIEELFKGKLDNNKINKYKLLIENRKREYEK